MDCSRIGSNNKGFILTLVICFIVSGTGEWGFAAQTIESPVTGEYVPVIGVHEVEEDLSISSEDLQVASLFKESSPLSAVENEDRKEEPDFSTAFGLPTDELMMGDWNGDGKTNIGLRRGNNFYLDMNGNGKWDTGIDSSTAFGLPTDELMMGDWNGDGKTNIGLRRGNNFYLDMNGNGKWDTGIDSSTAFGLPTDELMMGDWNGDGKTNIGLRRGNNFYLDMNGNGKWDTGIDSSTAFGLPTDALMMGDWNGDGKTNIGLRRGNNFYLDMNGNGKWDTGIDSSTAFGLPTDALMMGDWNGDGKTNIGLRRGNNFYLDMNGNGKWDTGIDSSTAFGLPTDELMMGDWNGDGKTNIGLRRGNNFYLDMNGNGKWDTGIDPSTSGVPEAWTQAESSENYAYREETVKVYDGYRHRLQLWDYVQHPSQTGYPRLPRLISEIYTESADSPYEYVDVSPQEERVVILHKAGTSQSGAYIPAGVYMGRAESTEAPTYSAAGDFVSVEYEDGLIILEDASGERTVLDEKTLTPVKWNVPEGWTQAESSENYAYREETVKVYDGYRHRLQLWDYVQHPSQTGYPRLPRLISEIYTESADSPYEYVDVSPQEERVVILHKAGTSQSGAYIPAGVYMGRAESTEAPTYSAAGDFVSVEYEDGLIILEDASGERTVLDEKTLNLI